MDGPELELGKGVVPISDSSRGTSLELEVRHIGDTGPTQDQQGLVAIPVLKGLLIKLLNHLDGVPLSSTGEPFLVWCCH